MGGVESSEQSIFVALATVEQTHLFRDVQQTGRFSGDKLDHRLVAGVLNRRPGQALGRIQRLLTVKQLLIKQLLHALICVINTQLLETIGLQNLKAKNIQQTNESRHHRGSRSCSRSRRVAHRIVDFLQQIRREGGVDELNQGMNVVRYIVRVELFDMDTITIAHLYTLGKHTGLEGEGGHTQEECQLRETDGRGNQIHLLVVLVYLRPVCGHALALNVTQMQHHRQHGPNLTQFLSANPHSRQSRSDGIQGVLTCSTRSSTSSRSSKGGYVVVAVTQNAKLFRRGEVQVRLQLGIGGCSVQSVGRIQQCVKHVKIALVRAN
mmetsp:Transcript_8835/g.15031  ORF Transcript_8835/g.15031 Transcript_8835/m.15031 type:complete len:322 (-) Transcript_8835:858-1823(-)